MQEPSPFDLGNLSIDKLGLTPLGGDLAASDAASDAVSDAASDAETADETSGDGVGRDGTGAPAEASQSDSARNVTPIASRRAARDSSEGGTER
jgi:hypothetical protein